MVCLDGFTGFTPTQYELLREILGVCEDMYITVTTDRTGHRDRVFSMSADTIRRLTQMAGERGVLVEEPVITGFGREKIPYRVAKNCRSPFTLRCATGSGMRFPMWRDGFTG